MELEIRYGIHNRPIRRWAQRYKERGILAFERGTGNKGLAPK